MDKDTFAEVIANTIKKYGTNPQRNKFLDVLQRIGSTGVGESFWLNMGKPRYLSDFSEFINQDDLSYQDVTPLTYASFWQPKGDYKSWLYTIKILSDLTPGTDEWNKILNDGDILPAGLDKKDDPSANTIWNVIEETGEKQVKNNKQQEEEKSIDVDNLQKSLKKNGADELNKNQLKGVIAYIKGLLKQ